MAKEKVNLYLLAIVAIVAVVGIVVLILNAGTTSLSLSDEDLTGQAVGPSAGTNCCHWHCTGGGPSCTAWSTTCAPAQQPRNCRSS